MMEIGKRDFEPSWSIPADKGFAGEAKPGGLGLAFEEVKGKPPEASDGFVVVDIESLALLAAASASSPIVDACEKDLVAGNQAPLKKTLSKKGSQRGGERRTTDCIAAACAAAAAAACAAAAAAASDRESSSVLIHVASDGEAVALPPTKSSTLGVVGAGGRSRRIAGRRQGQRLDPRRVVVLFATLSSMGTLILLYFTLSLGKMSGGNTNAR